MIGGRVALAAEPALEAEAEAEQAEDRPVMRSLVQCRHHKVWLGMVCSSHTSQELRQEPVE